MALPVGQSSEVTPGSKVNPPGVYKHEASGAVLSTSSMDGGSLAEGVTQADALVRLGYVWVGEAPSRAENVAAQQKQAEADKAAEDAENKDAKDSKETK